MIPEPCAIASGGLTSRPCDRRHQLRIAQDVERLLQRLEIVGADQHERRSAIAGDQNPFVVSLDPIRELGEMALVIREWQRVTHRSES